MSMEPITNVSAAPRSLVETSAPSPVEQLESLLASAANPPEDWDDRLETIRNGAEEIGLWDDDCIAIEQKIRSAAADHDLDQLQLDVSAGRLIQWPARLDRIRSHAGSSWNAGHAGKARAIALTGMDGELRSIDGAMDAGSKRLNIDVAAIRNRTARDYGVDLFTDRAEGFARVKLSWQYRNEAVGELQDAGRALADKDLPMAGYKTGQALESAADAHLSFYRGVRLMVTDKDVLPFLSPIALGRRIFE